MATLTQWNMELAVERLRHTRPALEAELQRLTALLKPSTARDIQVCLGKLVLHCPTQNMGPEQQTMLFRDYINDLSRFPAHIVALACEDYRLNPANRFFPSAAKLIELADIHRRPLHSKHRAIERLLNEMDQPPTAPENMATAEDWERLRNGLRPVVPEASPIQPSVPDRTYFEQRAAARQTEQPADTEQPQPQDAV